ncbi:MAG: hypothetical protein WBQ08_10115 [Candidatus Sulfotelmatobacter sp.]
MRDHQHGHVDDRDRVCGAQLPRQCRKADLDGVVIVGDKVDHSHNIKGHDKQPKERTYSHREKREDGEHSGCQVPVGGERGEAGGGQIRADYAWKDKDEPEEAEAVQGSDGAMRFDLTH